jgi:hypothetical protein
MRFALFGCLILACNGDPGGVKPTAPSSDIAFYKNGGGCYPTGTMSQIQDMIVLVNPEWVPVHDGQRVDSEPVLVHGIAHNPHGDTGGDAPMTHTSSDMNATLELEPEDRWRAASGNIADEDGFLELEWESNFVPDWSWPGEGDRVVALGRWIFDCGHPGEVPGHCVAAPATACVIDGDCAGGDTCIDQHFRYQSELHPPYAMAVMREGRGAVVNGTAMLATRADVYVSPNAGAAGDECMLTHEPRVTDVIFSRQCYPLSHPIAKLHSRDFVFDVPLPARPTGAHAVWQVMDRPPDGGMPAQVAVVAVEDTAEPHLTVTVNLTDPHVTGYSATIFAGWGAPATLTHVRVTVSGVVITNALKPAAPVGRPSPGWRLQIAANGEWQRLTGLQDVMAPQTVQENVVLDQWLPAGVPLHLFVNGTSASCIDTMFGKDIMTDIAELGDLSHFGDCLLSVNADPGIVDVEYAAPDYGAGMHETAATHSQGGVCGNSQTPCLSSTDCTGGLSCNPTGTAYTLQYKIDVIP